MRETLCTTVPRLLTHAQDAGMIFLGAGSDAFAAALRQTVPALRDRIFAGGALASDDLAAHLAACDVLLQPYEDGVTTRRGSIIAALALCCAVITTGGPMTEPLWPESDAVVLVPDGDFDAFVKSAFALGRDLPRRTAIGLRARDLYARSFALEHTVAALKRRALQERLLPT
jgi:glycosyltransferase involved in cell wall biosynthesis